MMAITGLHVPHDKSNPLKTVSVNERDAMSYYPYVQGGPVEGAYLNFEEGELVSYVNSRFAQFEEDLMNDRATRLFSMAGVKVFGGVVKGDVLVVHSPGSGEYERSLPQDVLTAFLGES